jgi:hypothetical protein
MMAPERNAQFSGYVCPKQDPSHRLAGLDLRQMDDFKKIEHGQFIVNTALHELADLKEMNGVKAIVWDQIAQADAAKTTVAELADLQAKGKKKGDLRKAFSDAIKATPEVEAHVENFVKPGLVEAHNYMRKLFTDLSAKTETRKQRAAFWSFARFFRSQPVRDMQMDAEALPFAEAADIKNNFRQLARDVTTVCDRLDAESKAQYQKQQNEGMPDFRDAHRTDRKPPVVPAPDRDQNNTPPVQGTPLPRRPRKGPPQNPRHEEGRTKRTFGRPGHFKSRE